MLLLLSAYFFQIQSFQKNLSEFPSECQTIWMQISTFYRVSSGSKLFAYKRLSALTGTETTLAAKVLRVEFIAYIYILLLYKYIKYKKIFLI